MKVMETAPSYKTLEKMIREYEQAHPEIENFLETITDANVLSEFNRAKGLIADVYRRANISPEYRICFRNFGSIVEKLHDKT
jgi:hypothetical protein